MKQSSSISRKILLTLYLAAIHLMAGMFIYQSFVNQYFNRNNNYAENVTDPTEIKSVPTPMPIPSIIEAAPEPTENNTNQTQNIAQPENNVTSDSPGELMIPVVGIKREQLQDTFDNARSEGRVHNAIDIIAPGGTTVVAAADGEIAKFFDSKLGGITIYQYSSDRRFVYYYAHLQKRADNLKEKDFVKRGTVLGYVGDTGNAGAGNYHLHFTVTVITEGQQYWEGTDINPYPLLKTGIESR